MATEIGGRKDRRGKKKADHTDRQRERQTDRNRHAEREGDVPKCVYCQQNTYITD